MPYRWPWRPPPPSECEEYTNLATSMGKVAMYHEEAIKHCRRAERAAVIAIALAVISFLCQTVVIFSRWGWF